MAKQLQIFCGNATPSLASDVAKHLQLPLGKSMVGRYSDGEIMVEIQENVRGNDVFIIQSTCMPTNDNLMEICIMADALRRASASKITAVIPYFGYARQDRRVRSARVPITAKIVADILASVGISRVVTVDLHAEQIQGFFHIPVDNIYASGFLLNDVKQQSYSDAIFVSPDIGGVVRARAFAKKLNTDLAIIDKRRDKANVSEVMNIIGDVKGRECIIVDDIVDTAGTLCNAAAALKKQGANKVIAYCTHPVLSGNAINNLNNSDIDEIVVTDTIPLNDTAKNCNKIRVLNFGPTLAEVILRIRGEQSVSSMFDL